MLILLYNLYSLLFLLKNDINDIIFIEYSNRIACSNRVKQRCVCILQRAYRACFAERYDYDRKRNTSDV